MEPKQLLMLVAVSEEGSITAAARRLNLSQPAITKGLKNLELELDLSLVDRKRKVATLTTLGTLLARHGKVISAELRRAREEINSAREFQIGKIFVGMSPIAAPNVVPNVVQTLINRHPNAHVTMVEAVASRLYKMVVDGELDLAVGPLSESREESLLVEEPLFMNEISIICGPNNPLAIRENLELAELSKYDWILPESRTPLRQLIENEFLRLNLTPPIPALETSSFTAVRHLLLNGDQISALPRAVIQVEEGFGLLKRLPIGIQGASWPIGIIYRQGAFSSPLISELIGSLRDTDIFLPPFAA
jgi:DNA-binding transcriptional LysR family regulator